MPQPWEEILAVSDNQIEDETSALVPSRFNETVPGETEFQNKEIINSLLCIA